MTEVGDLYPRHQQVVTQKAFPSYAYQRDRVYRSTDRDVVDLAPCFEVAMTGRADSVVFALLAYLDCDLRKEMVVSVDFVPEDDRSCLVGLMLGEYRIERWRLQEGRSRRVVDLREMSRVRS